MKLYGIFGCGGFGREVMPLAETMLKPYESSDEITLVFIDDNKTSDKVNSYPVFSIQEFIAYPASQKFFNIAIANMVIRKRIAESMMLLNITPFSIHAMNRVDLINNNIDIGAIFCPYTTVTADSKIGKFFHANIYSYVAHDCVVGDYVTFAPNAHCNGNVIVEDGAYIGSGALIRQGTPDNPMIIGKGAIVGMGAVVTKNVPAYETVIGNPARPLKKKATT